MKNILNILIIIALVVVIVLQLKENKETVEQRVYHYDKEQAISVHTQTLLLQNESENYELTGNFMPNKDTRINSEMQGKITSISVDNGSKVRKGQKLVKLDDSLLRLQLKSLDVKIDGLKTDIARFKILAEADAIQAVKLEKAELGLRTVNAQRKTVVAQINKTVVYAPFTGIITMKMTEVGSFASPQMPLLQLTDLSKLKFTVNVPETDVTLFELNKIYDIKVDAFPNLDLKGKATMIGSRSNKSNNYPIQFEVKNTKNQKIKSGMFGKITLDNSNSSKKIVIPASTVVGSSVKPQVYLVKEGKATLQNIVVASRVGNNIVVESGLNAGDIIVSGGFINIFDGANVTFE